MTCLPLRLVLIAVAFAAPAFARLPDRNSCPASSADDYYFAAGMLGRKPRPDEFERHWYSSQLAAMGEPSLSCGTQKGATYRFTWLRTFDHPVTVRVVEDRGQVLLTAVELSGAGGYKPGHVFRRLGTALTKSQFEQLRQAINSSAFWSLSTKDERMGFDGSEWIIEASENGSYHVVVRWTPSDGPVHDLGLQFLKLTGWQFQKMY